MPAGVPGVPGVLGAACRQIKNEFEMRYRIKNAVLMFAAIAVSACACGKEPAVTGGKPAEIEGNVVVKISPDRSEERR